MNNGSGKNTADSIWDQGEPLARDDIDYYNDWPPANEFRGIKLAIIGLAVLAVLATAGWFVWRSQVPVSYGEQAREYLDEGDYQAAITELKAVIQRYPTDPEMHWLLGSAYLQLNQPRPAMDSLESAFELGYFEQPLLLALAQAYLLDGEYDEALGLVREWSDEAETEEASVQWEILRARTLRKKGKQEPATDAFVKVLQLDPGNLEAKRALAQGRIGPELAAWVGSDIGDALATGRDQAETWLLKGELELSRADYESARASFEKAREMAPGDVYALSGLVRTLLAAQDVDAVAGLVAELEQRFPDDPAGSYVMARYYWESADYERARSALEVVLDHDPYHPMTLLLLGEVQQALGEHEQALRNLGRFHRMQPDNLQGRKKLARAYIENGQPGRAVDLLRALGGAAYTDPEIVELLAAGSELVAEEGEQAELQSSAAEVPDAE
jgi:tetratricopeptide (TPR) repeat protein